MVPNTHLVIYVQKYLLCNEKMFHWYEITYELQQVHFYFALHVKIFVLILSIVLERKFSKQNQLMQNQGYPKTYLLPNNEKIQSKVNRQSSLK